MKNFFTHNLKRKRLHVIKLCKMNQIKFSSERLFNESCILINSLMEREWAVETSDGLTEACYPIAFDPESKIFVAGNGNNKQLTVTFYFPAHIKSVTVGKTIADENILAEIRKLKTSTKVRSDFSQRKKMVTEWFRKHLIDVVDKDDCIEVAKQVRIEEPYDVENCISDNTIVLDRIQKMLNNMPS